ncbi:hypothetical protein PZA11_002412 [Diplocarpon coronariae]|uniref:Uncharacterized protein n=1 Tax=Diplocarpon coronariae TaxID=2795749 RepID=A0A218ZBH4_9HELO|nr:hypothetical protein B2J93_8372 [Marssonina coronariae]
MPSASLFPGGTRPPSLPDLRELPASILATPESRMAERSSSSPAGAPLRRSLAVDEPRQRLPSRLPTRRRSSNFSDSSLREVLQSSTDDLLLPKPSLTGESTRHDSSAWDSAPLAFALLPALGGMLFTDGSSVITDVMLLGLAAIFLNWSVRLPWDWYHSAQRIRKMEEYNEDTLISEESEDEALSLSQATLEEVPEEDEPSPPPPRSARRFPAHEAATNELYTHELLALLSCFLFPALGAYLLHTIRAQLTRPSEGLVSNYNLTIFLLASELRPMAHLVKLIQARTLHLQRVVGANPADSSPGNATGGMKDITRRLEDLEARGSKAGPHDPTAEPALSSKQSAMLSAEVRRSLQPDLDALNRAVRRYEKRATLQAFQTESRLHDLESRLNDAISLAAAAANSAHHKRGFTGIVVEWAATAIVIPLQTFGTLAGFPFKAAAATVAWSRTRVLGRKAVGAERGRKPGNAGVRIPSTGRLGDRVQVRGVRK